jgi:hypothetical protein
MAMNADFLSGVIEGFYGPPWSQGERFQLFGWMKEWGLNTYLYAPKDDLKHRALWREIYTDEEAECLKSLIAECAAKGVRFIYGIAPGLDIRYSDDSELLRLKDRLDQMQGFGCRDFALLFDDIPDRMRNADKERFGCFASAHAFIANTLFSFLPVNARFLFCPTPYCGRMLKAGLGGPNYLETVGEKLAPLIGIFWTGPEIISREISVEHVREVAAALRRKPIIWDNLHANDYDGRRFFVGPYSGRPLELRDEVQGILSNPNCEFPLNYVPLRTLGNYVRGDEGEPRHHYYNSLKDWQWSFGTTRKQIEFKDLVLFCDCFYLPYEDGAEADWMIAKLKNALKKGGNIEELGRLRDFCALLAEISDRALFYALSRRIWELREEVDLLDKFLTKPNSKFMSDFHLPGIYRGGLVARLQTLLKQKEDGTFDT